MSGHEVPPVDPLTPREIAMLCDHGWVDAADSLMRTRQATGLGDAAEHRAGSLAKIVRRVLTLDAEDFERSWPNTSHHGSGNHSLTPDFPMSRAPSIAVPWEVWCRCMR